MVNLLSLRDCDDPCQNMIGSQPSLGAAAFENYQHDRKGPPWVGELLCRAHLPECLLIAFERSIAIILLPAHSGCERSFYYAVAGLVKWSYIANDGFGQVVPPRPHLSACCGVLIQPMGDVEAIGTSIRRRRDTDSRIGR